MTNGDHAEPIRLLLVEDDPESASSLVMMLRKRGLVVTAKSSAEEALLAFGDTAFDAVVADIRLEGMSGVGLLGSIRARNVDFPVILLTGYDSLETAIQAVRLGAQDYILKPLDSIDDLLGPVRNAVQAHRLLLSHRDLQARLRSLASELVLAEERERRRLASDVHDSIGQSLAVCKLKLDMLASQVTAPGLSQSLGEIRTLLEEVIAQCRSLTFQLSPAILYDIGLEAAVDELCTDMQRNHGLRAIFHDDGALKPLSQDAMVLLFRAVREVLFNVVKHARATEVLVSIEKRDGRVSIVVDDNGAGFDTSVKASRGGYGLFSIRQRLQNLGGDMDLVSAPGRGTRIGLELPLSREGSPENR